MERLANNLDAIIGIALVIITLLLIEKKIRETGRGKAAILFAVFACVLIFCKDCAVNKISRENSQSQDTIKHGVGIIIKQNNDASINFGNLKDTVVSQGQDIKHRISTFAQRVPPQIDAALKNDKVEKPVLEIDPYHKLPRRNPELIEDGDHYVFGVQVCSANKFKPNIVKARYITFLKKHRDSKESYPYDTTKWLELSENYRLNEAGVCPWYSLSYDIVKSLPDSAYIIFEAKYTNNTNSEQPTFIKMYELSSKYLNQNQQEVGGAPFKEIMSYLLKERVF